MKMLELAVAGAHRNGRYCGICGQYYPTFPKWPNFSSGWESTL